jgi:hypothetical protein
MKATRVVWCVALLLAAGVAVGLSQPQEWSSDDPFNGTWRINIEKSKKLAAGRASVPVYEVITFDIKDNMQTYRVEVQSRDDTPRRNMGYESAWNDGKYVPYTNYTSGEIIGYVTNVKVDDRTHYRVATGVDGEARYVMMRRLTEDGSAYIATGLSIDGELGQFRWMDRVE